MRRRSPIEKIEENIMKPRKDREGRVEKEEQGSDSTVRCWDCYQINICLLFQLSTINITADFYHTFMMYLLINRMDWAYDQQSPFSGFLHGFSSLWLSLLFGFFVVLCCNFHHFLEHK